jgi:hypothetical protein
MFSTPAAPAAAKVSKKEYQAYINSMKTLVSPENSILTKYGSVTGDNYTDDETMYEVLTALAPEMNRFIHESLGPFSDFLGQVKTEVTAEKPMFFQLKRFGGTFGVTPQHNLMTQPFQVTDGIEDSLNGDHLGLSIDMKETESGLYKLKGLIVRYSGEKPTA